jgi:NAD(P)-dependent dehydrogenase (short-subunit alcohol dehydrogenase family)
MKDGGSIVNFASIAGLIGFAKNAPYVASKHAVIGITKTAAKELGHRGIRCNAVCP